MLPQHGHSLTRLHVALFIAAAPLAPDLELIVAMADVEGRTKITTVTERAAEHLAALIGTQALTPVLHGIQFVDPLAQ
jgi:hypothetical protein